MRYVDINNKSAGDLRTENGSILEFSLRFTVRLLYIPVRVTKKTLCSFYYWAADTCVLQYLVRKQRALLISLGRPNTNLIKKIVKWVVHPYKWTWTRYAYFIVQKFNRCIAKSSINKKFGISISCIPNFLFLSIFYCFVFVLTSFDMNQTDYFFIKQSVVILFNFFNSSISENSKLNM